MDAHLGKRLSPYGCVLGTLAALVMAVACSSGDTSSGSASGDEDDQRASYAPVDGCGDRSWTDPSDLAADRAPARCEAGAPAPQPLDERQTLRVVLNNTSTEYVAPLVYAVEEGEFEAENLDVEIETLPTADAYPLLANGEIDALWSGPNAGFVNAVDAGFDLKWVMGNFSPDESSQTGLWASVGDGQSRDRDELLAELSGSVMGSVTGPGSVTSYPIAQALDEAGLSLDDVEIQVLPFADIVTALQNGSVDSGWVVDPLWQELQDDPSVEFLIGQPAGEPLGGLLFGPNLQEDREAGVAFVRALIRTVNTHFDDDYKSDPQFLSQLATMLDQPEEQLAATPPLIWDWEIRDETITRMQDAYLDEASQQTDGPLPEDQLVDRTFYEEAVGHGAQ
jgi:NitT/TauT family transport system substrate-binding protein